MLPKNVFPQAKFLDVLITELGDLIARPTAGWFLLREFHAVDLVLAFEILQCRIGRDVASPDTTARALPVDGQDGEGRVVAE